MHRIFIRSSGVGTWGLGFMYRIFVRRSMQATGLQGLYMLQKSSCTWLSARSQDAKVVALGKGLKFASVPTVRAHLGYPAND